MELRRFFIRPYETLLGLGIDRDFDDGGDYCNADEAMQHITTLQQRIAALERQLAEAPFNADLRSRMNAQIVDPLEDVRLDEYILLGMAGATE